MNNETDQTYIEAFINGDTTFFGEIVLAYQNRIYSLCRYLLENTQDAEDAAQDTFVKAYRNLGSYTPSASFYTWLYRIAVNTCIDHQRKTSFRSFFFPADTNDSIDAFPSSLPTPEAALVEQESRRDLQAAFKKIPVKQRAAIVLREIDGLSYDEIAVVLDVSVGTVKSRISRAREELKKNMEQKRKRIV